MVWALLAMVGVPLWLCALGLTALVFRNRKLRTRHGDIPVRVRRPGKTRWARGHAVWVSDVLAWRGSPAAWNENIFQVMGATVRGADAEERKALHLLGDDPVIATLTTADGSAFAVAAKAEHRSALLGPFLTGSEPVAAESAVEHQCDSGQPHPDR